MLAVGVGLDGVLDLVVVEGITAGHCHCQIDQEVVDQLLIVHVDDERDTLDELPELVLLTLVGRLDLSKQASLAGQVLVDLHLALSLHEGLLKAPRRLQLSGTGVGLLERFVSLKTIAFVGVVHHSCHSVASDGTADERVHCSKVVLVAVLLERVQDLCAHEL